MELLKGAKHLQSNSDSMDKIKEISNTALPPSLLHAYFLLFIYVSLPWEGVL